jgi:hypothetical protein
MGRELGSLVATMRIERVHSHLNGMEFIQVHRLRLWKQVERIVTVVDADACRNKEGGSWLRAEFRLRLMQRGWKDGPAISRDQTNLVKDRIAVGVRFGEDSNLVRAFSYNHLASYIRDEIDVGVEILATESMEPHASPGIGTYDLVIDEVARRGRGAPAVPLVIIGVTP